MTRMCDAGVLEAAVSLWPGVHRRQARIQVVFSVSGVTFLWISPGSGMVQIPPALGPRLVTRRLERHGSRVKVIRQRTGEQDAEYYDPGLRLEPRWSYPGLMCSRTPQTEAESLVRQAYELVQSKGQPADGARPPRRLHALPPNGSQRGSSGSAPHAGITPRVIQVPMEEELVQTLDSCSQKLGRSRADIIREACRRYLKRIEREELDRIYREGYDRLPEEPIMALTQAGLLAEVLPKEEW